MDYIEAFSNLKTSNKYSRKSPHKAVLLLTIIELIERNQLSKNEIYYNELLVSTFQKVWNYVLPNEELFEAEAYFPFWFMQSERFWHITPVYGFEKTISDFYLNKVKPTEARVKEFIKYVELDADLYFLMTLRSGRMSLKRVLLETYTNLSEDEIDKISESEDMYEDKSISAINSFKAIIDSSNNKPQTQAEDNTNDSLKNRFYQIHEDIQISLNLEYYLFLKKNKSVRDIFKNLFPSVFELYDRITLNPFSKEDLTPSFLYTYIDFLSDLRLKLMSEVDSIDLIDSINNAINAVQLSQSQPEKQAKESSYIDNPDIVSKQIINEPILIDNSIDISNKDSINEVLSATNDKESLISDNGTNRLEPTQSDLFVQSNSVQTKEDDTLIEEDNRSSNDSNIQSQNKGITIEEYSAKAFIVYGKTLQFTELFREYGGKYLKWNKVTGWVFSKKRIKQIRDFISAYKIECNDLYLCEDIEEKEVKVTDKNTQLPLGKFFVFNSGGKSIASGKCREYAKRLGLPTFIDYKNQCREDLICLYNQQDKFDTKYLDIPANLSQKDFDKPGKYKFNKWNIEFFICERRKCVEDSGIVRARQYIYFPIVDKIYLCDDVHTGLKPAVKSVLNSLMINYTTSDFEKVESPKVIENKTISSNISPVHNLTVNSKTNSEEKSLAPSNIENCDVKNFQLYLTTIKSNRGQKYSNSSINVYVTGTRSSYVIDKVLKYHPSGNIFNIDDVTIAEKLLSDFTSDFETKKKTSSVYISLLMLYIRFLKEYVFPKRKPIEIKTDGIKTLAKENIIASTIQEDKRYIRISYLSGEIDEQKNALKTFVNFVKKVGVQSVFNLHIKCDESALIIPEADLNNENRLNYQLLDNGFYLYSNTDTEQKYNLVIKILIKLDFYCKVEYMNGYTILESYSNI